jgi:phosphatidylserine/phosphatidylglycerophosphate/cardiolipin synthase-like enzyme
VIATEKWFSDADAADTTAKQVKIRELAHRSLTITHAKAVIAGGQEAVLLGSPFDQVYYDSQSHLVDEARRGGVQSKGPIHDVSVGLRGPAVGDLQELFNSHWNIADPSDLRDMPPKLKVPAAVVGSTDLASDEFVTTVQMVLTKDRKFTQAPQDGEKGVQEAYLRAIYFARQFIYIENQYFYNRPVVQGIIDALKANKKLVLILLLNPSPDMPYYLRWQNTALQSIIDALTDKKDKAAVGRQLGVFSSWSYADAAPGKTLPRLSENYLHTKSAIIDNNWATVGSANLDGASMDAEDYLKSVMDGEARHTEANVVVSEDGTEQHSAVDALRRSLWGEHLGFFKADTVQPDKIVVDTANSQLDGSSTTPGSIWLNLWNTRAKARLAALAGNTDDAKAIQILPWPVTNVKLSAWHDLTSSIRGAKDHYAREIYLDHLFSENGGNPPLKRSQFDLSAPQGAPFKYLEK